MLKRGFELYERKRINDSYRLEQRGMRFYGVRKIWSKSASLPDLHHVGAVINKCTPLTFDLVLRITRVMTGLLILLTITTAILIPQVLPVSGNSFVNAELEWIRTPIEGDLAFGDFKVGDQVPSGAVLGTVSNERADDIFLNQLLSERSSLESLLFTLKNRGQNLSERRQSLQVQATASLADLKEKTSFRLKIIENEMRLSTEESAALNERLARYRKANKNYKGREKYAVVSRSAIESLTDRQLELQTSITSQENTIRLLQSNLESAVNGAFVSENTPLEKRQLFEVEQSLANLQSEIESLALKSDNLSSRIDKRLEHLEKNTQHELVAGVSGTLWDLAFSDGSYLRHGDSVIAIADTSTVNVEGYFHQRYLDNIKTGDPATVELMGSSERLTGTVSEIRIRDQIKSSDLSAFNLDTPATDEFKVVVALDTTHAQDVYIGQRAKVIISKSKSSVLPSLMLWFK